MTDPGLDPSARTDRRERRGRSGATARRARARRDSRVKAGRTRPEGAAGPGQDSPGQDRSSRDRSGRGRSRSRTSWEILLGALVLLAIVASVIMVFTDSVPLLRIGLVAALWAAVVGAIAMTKFRKDSESDAARARDLKLVYELQLEREVSARREYELVVENQVRGQVEQQVRAETSEHMQALVDEVASLRASLEMLFDGDLPDERVAVRAQSHRVHELAGTPGKRVAEQAAELPEIDDVVAVAPEAAPDGDGQDFEPDYAAYREAAQWLPGAGGADEDPEDALEPEDAEDTEDVEDVEDVEGALEPDAAAEEDAAEPEWDTADEADEDADPDAADEEYEAAAPEDADDAEDAAEHATGTGGNTVAELLERMRQSGTVPENLGRRRRRAED